MVHAHRVLSASLVLLASVGVAIAGSLTPPPGPIAPEMKDLNALEPRRILGTVPGTAQCVHRITEPGQYVVTADIIVPAGKHGILLDLPPGTTAPVTIDMNGFEVRGQPGSLDGVRRSGAFIAADFNYRDGAVVGMGGDGVHIENMNGAHLSISARQCGGDGFEFMGVPQVSAVAINSKAPPPGAGNIVKGMGGHCVRASGCGEVVIDLTLQDAGQDGLRIENCDRCEVSFDVSNCAGNGVTITGVPEVAGVAIKQKGIGAEANRVAGSGGSGVILTQCDSVEIAELRVSGSGGGGGGGIPGAGRGVVFSNCSRVSARDVVITDCTNHGVEVSDCIVAVLSDVRLGDIGGNGLHATVVSGGFKELTGLDVYVDSFAGNGIHISGISAVQLLGGSLSNGGGDGVHIEDGVVAGDKFAQVRGFKVERCAGDGMKIECDDLILAECTTRDNAGNGVFAKNIRKNITVTLHKSHKNLMNGLLVSDAAARGGARQQGKSTQVTRSNISNNRAAGIFVETAGSLSMDEVECDGNDEHGLYALLLPALGSVQEKAKQVKCRFNNNGFGTPQIYPGALIQGASSLEMREVECTGNAASGLVVADLNRDGRLDQVTCTDNGEWGVRCMSTTGVPAGRFKVHAVHCGGNHFDGMMLEGSAGGEIADSTFSGNGSLGLRVLSFNHLVHRNAFVQNSGGSLFALLPGNTIAPVVDEGSLPTNCNPSANHLR